MKIRMMMPIMAFACMLLCAGCSSDDDEKVWESEGWQSFKYAMVEKNDRNFIEVPMEGGTYTFTRTDAKDISISSIDFDPIDIEATVIWNYRDKEAEIEKHKYSFSNKWCEVTVNGNMIQFRFLANTGFERQALASIKVANDFEPFCFLQKSAYQSVAGNRLVGDWVKETEDRNYFAFGAERLSLHADGTYVYTFDPYVRSSVGYQATDEIGHWRDSADCVIFHSTFNRDWAFKYKFANGKLYKTGTNICYSRVEDAVEPIYPYYQLEVVPSKSASWKYMKAGEPYTLNINLYAKGGNYTLENIYLERFQSYSGTERLDISGYRKSNGDYSIPMTAPTVWENVSFKLCYDVKFTSASIVNRYIEGISKVKYLDFTIRGR